MIIVRSKNDNCILILFSEQMYFIPTLDTFVVLWHCPGYEVWNAYSKSEQTLDYSKALKGIYTYLAFWDTKSHTQHTFEMGISMLSLKEIIALVSSTMNTPNAAFSKSVSCTSHGRNSTRQPMSLLTGGILKRMVCQLVLWMFWGKDSTCSI